MQRYRAIPSSLLSLCRFVPNVVRYRRQRFDSHRTSISQGTAIVAETTGEPIIDHHTMVNTINMYYDSRMNIEDITSDEINRKILHKLKNNDPSFTSIRVCNPGGRFHELRQERVDVRNNIYCPSGGDDLGWLGHFIGKNTHLTRIELANYTPSGEGAAFSRQDITSFGRGFNSNKSIREIKFWNINLSEGEFFPLLAPFLSNNQSLIDMEMLDCTLSRECANHLALIIESRVANSLTVFVLENCGQIDDESFAAILRALSRHSRLKGLGLGDNLFGRNSYSELATLLRGSFPSLYHLYLGNSTIDDEGINEMAMALTENSTLTELVLSHNRSITLRGYQSLSTLLENPSCSLQMLNLKGSNVDDEAMSAVANALSNNQSLKYLFLGNNHAISASKGWVALSRALCDVSNINKTFLSNHTLQTIRMQSVELPHCLISSLRLNRIHRGKPQVAAVNKILMHHDDFNMDSFFECGLKLLPFVIDWFERAKDFPRDFEANIEQRKLSAMFQFVRECPLLCVAQEA